MLGALAVPSPALAVPTTAPAAPVRVLLTGDSITQGFNGDPTWRYYLAREFTRQRIPVDFVGSRRLPAVLAGYRTSVYAAPRFDSDHFAQGGGTLWRQQQTIGAEVRLRRPDVTFLEAGLNDLIAGVSPQQLEGNLRRWVSNVRAAGPGTRIVLSPVLQARRAGEPWLPQRIAAYDALLRATAQRVTTAESPVTVADTARGWDVARHTWDDIHPTPTGATRIAQNVALELHRVGVLRSAPSIYRSTPWQRNLAARATVVGRRVRLQWDRQAVSYVRVQTRRQGHSWRLLRPKHSRGTATTARLDRRATYQFRLVAVRGRMTSTPGPVTSVRVVSPREARARHR